MIQNRRWIVAATLIICLCLAWAPGSVAAGHALVTASDHTTDTDFNGATTLDNVTVIDTGTPAHVNYGNATVDDAEDGDLSEYTGDTGGFEINSSNPFEGSNAIHATFTTTRNIITSTSGLDSYPEAGETIHLRIHQDGNDTARPGFRFGVQDASNHYWIEIRDDVDEVIFVKRNTSDGTTTLHTETGVDTPNSTYYTPEVTWHTNGSIEVSIPLEGGGTADFTVEDDQFTNGGIAFTNDDGTATFDFYTTETLASQGTYVSQTHAASNISQGFTNITLDNATAEVTWLADTDGDGTFETTAATDTYTTTGNKTTDLSTTSADDWRVNVTYVENGDDPDGELHDEGLQFRSEAPTGSNFSPSDGTNLSDSSVTFEVDVNDTDFGFPQGDTVTATLQTQGPSESSFSDAGQTTTSSNGTVSITDTLSEGGDWTYRWVLEDSYGESTTTSPNTVTVPAEISIRNVSSPDDLINESTIDIKFYHGDNITTRSTTDGTVDLSGLPVDEPMVVQASAPEYRDRTIVIKSIYDQASIYLLNESISAYAVRFELQDPTGDYPREDTILRVERAINQSGNTTWVTAAGDEFGVAGILFNLEADERYRLVIENIETGQQASRGAFIPIQDESVTLSTGSATISFDDVEANYTWETHQNDSSINFEYVDEGVGADSLKLTIHERYNQSNVLVDNATFTDVSSLSYTQPLNANQSNMTWTAQIYIDRGDGYVHYTEQIGTDARDLIPSDLSDVWRNAIGVFILFISSMIFSQLNMGVGAVATSMTAALLWYLGFLALVTTGPAVALAVLVSAVYQHRQTGGGV